MFRDPIPTDTPMESGTLRVYNWNDYFYKRVLREFEDQYGVTVEWTTFNNMEEGIQKLVTGQVQADVFFPTTDYVARLVERDLLQPLNHDLIPNLPANYLACVLRSGALLRPRLAVHRPVRDLHDRRGVPPRPHRRRRGGRRRVRTVVRPAVRGAVSYYDSYRDALGMMLLRNGVDDPNTGDEAAIEASKDAILQLINDNGARLTNNGAYDELPQGEFTVAAVVVGGHRGREVVPAEGRAPETSSATGTRPTGRVWSATTRS